MPYENSLRNELENGNATAGAVTKAGSPLLVRVLGDTGMDFVFVDLEHGGMSPLDSTHLEELVRAAKLADVELLVRLPSGDPPLIRKVLDTGVQNLLIPRVRTAAEVRRVVEASRFEYDGSVGRRGFVTGCQANSWGQDLDGYLNREDETTLVGVIVETRSAFENLDEILDVPELGFVFIGQRDLTVSLGHRQEVGHPEVQATVEEIRSKCISAGVPVGKGASDPAAARAAVENGYQLFLTGYDIDAVRDVFREWTDAFRGDA